jgi:type IV pilus assembly protein PilY1
VVFLTSGYNNVPGTENLNVGDGRGYLYVVDIATGRVLSKASTGVGSTTTPSGLAASRRSPPTRRSIRW